MSPLISAQALADHADETVILDCRFNLADPAAGYQYYLQGHIPGAHYAHLDHDLSAPITAESGRHPLPEPARFAKILGDWGITPATQVAVYDDAGGAFAGRAWWLLRHWLGHERVALLDGGLNAWLDAHLPTNTTQATTQPAEPYPAMPSSDSIISANAILSGLQQLGFVLVDARAAVRFSGREEAVDPVAGHIPGAVNRPFTENLTSDHRFKPAAQLHEEWQALLAGQPCVLMCGSGVTACHHLLALEVAGLSPGRLYPGSWSEWIRDPARPVATG